MGKMLKTWFRRIAAFLVLLFKSTVTCGAVVAGGSQDISKTIDVKLSTKNNNKYDLRNSFTLTLAVKTTGVGSYWQGVFDKKIYVIVRDEDNYWKNTYCYSTNDPRMRTFDGLYYSITSQSLIDEFVMMKHKTYPAEIRMLTETCNSGWAACGCGVIVRAGRDVFTVSHCYGDHMTEFLQYEDGVLEARRRSANRYMIYMPHGTTIDVVYSRGNSWSTMNIHIYPAPSDMDQMTGLCGNFNGLWSDDFLHSDRSTTPADSTWGSYPDAFSASWGIKNTGRLNESMFDEGYLDSLSSWSNEDSLCVCPLYADGSRYSLCSKKEDLTCVGDALVKPGVMVDTERRDQRSVDAKHENDIRERLRSLRQKRSVAIRKTNIVKRGVAPVSQDNTTFEEAYDICYQALTSDCGSTQVAQVLNGTNVTTVAQDCALDVMINKSISWYDSSCSVIQGTVENVATKDIEFQVENPTLVENITKQCIGSCSHHGKCLGADTCECDVGWGSSDCSVDKSIPPSTASIQGGGACDRRNKLCRSLRITTNGCAEDILCKLFHKKFIANSTHVVSQNASEGLISCQCGNGYDVYVDVTSLRSKRAVDDGSVVADWYSIQLTNDGVNYGESNNLIVLDSTCLELDIQTDTIILKSGYCVIESLCYADGFTTADGCKTCKVNLDRFSWQVIPDCGVTTTEVPSDDGVETWIIVIAVVIPVVALLLIAIIIACAWRRSRSDKMEANREVHMYDNPASRKGQY